MVNVHDYCELHSYEHSDICSYEHYELLIFRSFGSV